MIFSKIKTDPRLPEEAGLIVTASNCFGNAGRSTELLKKCWTIGPFMALFHQWPSPANSTNDTELGSWFSSEIMRAFHRSLVCPRTDKATLTRRLLFHGGTLLSSLPYWTSSGMPTIFVAYKFVSYSLIALSNNYFLIRRLVSACNTVPLIKSYRCAHNRRASNRARIVQ